jgi:hypothetical protein
MTGRQAATRAASGVQAAFEWVAGVPIRARRVVRDRQIAREDAVAKAAAPTVEERHEELLSFYDQYERLVDIICDGAQYGPEPKLQSGYSELRAWMQANYPRLRRYVTAYLQYDIEDAQQGLSLHGNPCDAFEALYAAPTLEEFLRGDDGMMISRIMRTRDALNFYGEHLRHLKARE